VKEQIETAVLRRKFVAGDSEEARRAATGHSCEALGVTFKKMTERICNEEKGNQNIF
jgi:hypothetical protein